ncbi:MAG: EamA family transporter, partial [Dongiaceae bacterium]
YTVTILVQGGVRGRVGARRVLCETTIAAAVLLFPLGLFGERPFLPPDATQGALMVALAVVTFAGQALVVYALGRLPVATAAVTGGLSVAFAAAGGWLLFAEPLGALQGLGFAVVLAAVLLAERKPSKPRVLVVNEHASQLARNIAS